MVRDGDEHNNMRELLPAYALHSLDDDEAAQVARHLDTCADCREELAAYEAVSDSLPLAMTEITPSAALKDQLFVQIREQPEEVPKATTASTSIAQSIHNWFTGSSWRPVAVGLGIVVLILSILLWQQLSFSNSVRFEQFVMTSTDAAPDATGLIIMGEDGEFGTLVVDRLPVLGDEQEYQLWLIKNGERTDGGVFSVYKTGYQTIRIHGPDPLASYTSFGVTVEPAGGSEQPTGQRVLEYNLSNDS